MLTTICKKLTSRFCYVLVFFICACDGTPRAYFDKSSSSKSTTTSYPPVSALNPVNLASYKLDLSSKFYTSDIVTSSDKITKWVNFAATNSSCTTPDPNNTNCDIFTSASASESPLLDTSQSLAWSTWSNGHLLTATENELPLALKNSNKFTFFVTLDAIKQGFLFNFGMPDDDSNAVKIIATATQLILTHVTDSTNIFQKKYSLPASTSTPVVLAFSFGAKKNDIDLYVNGVSNLDFTTVETNTPTDFFASPRKMSISHTGAGGFRLAQLYGFSDKLSSQKIYAISKYLSLVWPVVISNQVNREIYLDTVPSPAPDIMDYDYIEETVMNTYGCYDCHRPGGTGGVVFQNYAQVLSAKDVNGVRLVVPGDSEASALYQSIINGSMPKDRAALSTSDRENLKKWIDSGAIE